MQVIVPSEAIVFKEQFTHFGVAYLYEEQPVAAALVQTPPPIIEQSLHNDVPVSY